MKNEAALLYSGGTDSTYTAVLMSKVYDKVHLLTYDRLGFLNVENSKINVEKLKEKIGHGRFIHNIINVNKEFKTLTYGLSWWHYFRNLIKYRFYNLSTCGICKLSMHWRTIIYCIENELSYAADGSNREMFTDPAQQPIILKEIQYLYQGFGINYSTPIFDVDRKTRENTLFDMGITSVKYPKWSPDSFKMQPACSQEYLFLLFFQYACQNYLHYISEEQPEYKRYEEGMSRYHREKMEEIKKYVYHYLKNRGKGL